MYRVLNVMLAMLLAAAAARASPYWIEYEPASGNLPEQEGWIRHTYYGGDQRSIEDGWLVMDGMASPGIQDYYEMPMNGSLDPQVGEQFVLEWRIRVDDLLGYYDPSMAVFSNEGWAVGFVMSQSAIYSEFESEVSAPFEAGVPHVFDFNSADMRTYTLSIDGVPVIEGDFWLSLWDSRVQWGDGVCGGASLARWDYVRFAVVPEPNSVALGTGVSVCVIVSRLRRWR